MKELYLNGIIVAQGWLDKAKLENNTLAIASYQRILDQAIEQYQKLF